MKRLAIALTLLAAGCITHPQNPSATAPATSMDPATTQPFYWLDQPADVSATGSDFDALWAAAEDTARELLFKLDRADYRAGVLTTQPMISGQWLEPWRRDARTVHDRNESTLAAIRRTIRFEFTRQADGTWQVVPKVIVERQASAEKRITSVVMYRSAFANVRDPKDRPSGTRESDVGVVLPTQYWYPLRRDTEFERAIAQSMQKKLSRP